VTRGRPAPPSEASRQAASARTGQVSLARALSKLGYCSRKEAQRLIAAGRVSVGNTRETSPQRRVTLDAERLSVDGIPVRAPAERVVLALHKPVDCITSRSDPGGRPTVYGLLGELGRWVFPVGRLDRDSSGLLILTDDHQLGHALTDPDQHVPKTYHVRVRGVLAAEALTALRQGVPWSDGTSTRPARVRPLGVNRDGSSWIEITLDEGRNRQVRKMCAAIGHDVFQLVRVRIGDLELGDLPRGAWRRLAREEIARLLVGRRQAPARRARRTIRVG